MRAPAGWFVVAYSSELPSRGVTQLRYFGEPLLLFRAADGRPGVLGAEHWFFDGIPYHRNTPRARARAWRVCERNGLVMVHFHPERSAPTSEIPLLPEYDSPDWTPYVTRRWTMESDLHALVEQTLAARLVTHEEPNVHASGPDFRLRTRTELDTPIGRVPGVLDIQSHGTGFSLVRFTGAVETLLLTTMTPIDEAHVDARFSFSVKQLPNPEHTRAIEQRFVEELERQVEHDRRMRAHGGRRWPDASEAPAALRRRAQRFYG
jgi:phenylpropionate dioxygenase-like ring-hydroxylating dioxygenase large terminal subunit